jgi:hypothetical protein
LPSAPYRQELTAVFLTSPSKLSSSLSIQPYERSACWFCAALCFAAASW